MSRPTKVHDAVEFASLREMNQTRDILNNQGRGKCYQAKPKAEVDNTYLDLDYSGYHKNLIQ